MGIVNVTPDSFSDGGNWDNHEAAIAHGEELLAQGADILDIGGESTRPGSARVTAEQEAERVIPVIRELAARGAVISIDTMHATTAKAAIDAGACIVNDVSGGLTDPEIYKVIADHPVLYICQHWRGTPETMDTLTDYNGDVVSGVCAELSERLESAYAAGVSENQVIVDPGLGFAKTHPQSWTLLAQCSIIEQRLGRPVLIGASRKRFLALALDPQRASNPLERDMVTATTSALAAQAGVWAVRVHHVSLTCDAINTVALWKEHQ
nr:dihydropteroate synthase [Actinomyces vulturis]